MSLEEEKWDQLINTAHKLINPNVGKQPDCAYGGYIYYYIKEDLELVKNKAHDLSFEPPLNVEKALKELKQNGDEIMKRMRFGDKDAVKVFVTALCVPELAVRFGDPSHRVRDYGERTESWAQSFNGYTIINERRPFLNKIATLAREMGYIGFINYECQNSVNRDHQPESIIAIGPAKIDTSNLDKLSEGIEKGVFSEKDIRRCVQRMFDFEPTQEKDMSSEDIFYRDELAFLRTETEQRVCDAISEIQKMPGGEQILAQMIKEGVTAEMIAEGVEDLKAELLRRQEDLKETLDDITHGNI